jgi:hypothetical protein
MSATTKPPFANDAVGAHPLDRLVRRFVVQEARPDCRDGWYADPDIPECKALQEAIHKLRHECETNRGHGETYRHRIIERTERVVVSPYERVEAPK